MVIAVGLCHSGPEGLINNEATPPSHSLPYHSTFATGTRKRQRSARACDHNNYYSPYLAWFALYLNLNIHVYSWGHRSGMVPHRQGIVATTPTRGQSTRWNRSCILFLFLHWAQVYKRVYRLRLIPYFSISHSSSPDGHTFSIILEVANTMLYVRPVTH